MIERAEAANARLPKVFPKDFALDAVHHPHISMLQRYVHTGRPHWYTCFLVFADRQAPAVLAAAGSRQMEM